MDVGGGAGRNVNFKDVRVIKMKVGLLMDGIYPCGIYETFQ